jgi:hypothetical protein
MCSRSAQLCALILRLHSMLLMGSTAVVSRRSGLPRRISERSTLHRTELDHVLIAVTGTVLGSLRTSYELKRRPAVATHWVAAEPRRIGWRVHLALGVLINPPRSQTCRVTHPRPYFPTEG